MKNYVFMNIAAIGILCLFLMISLTSQAISQQSEDKIYLAVEFNEVICGYSEIVISDTNINGELYKILRQNTFANFHVLGKDIQLYQKFTYHINPCNGNFIYHDSYIKQGDMEIGGKVYFDGENINTYTLDGKNETISNLPENLILPNTQLFFNLKADFSSSGLVSKTYKVYDVRNGKISEIEYTSVGIQQMEFAGVLYDAIELLSKDPINGMENRMWIDKESGMRLKTESSNRMQIYLTDISVKSKVKTGNWDDVFL